MASAEAALVALLTTGSPNPVADIVGMRVYGKKLPQNVIYPAIRYTRISTPRDEWRTLDGREDYASPRMQIDCWALTDLAVIQLAAAVRQVLVPFQGTVNGIRIDAFATADEAGEVEADVGPNVTDVYRQRIDVLMYHAE